MADAWPESLPQCFLVGYGEGVGDNLGEYQPDVGPPITRRRSTSAPRPLSGSMRMTRAQLATFRNFFEVTLDHGALTFAFPDPTVVGNTLIVRFEKQALPAWQQIGAGVYRVPLSFKVMP